MNINDTLVDNKIISLLEDTVYKICIGTNLQYHYEFVRENNPSNNLPYHNWYHTLCMIKNCFDASEYYNLPMSSMRGLCAAALWHDYGHTGGKFDDVVNITNTINHFRNFHLSLSSCATRELDSDLCHVPSLISVTQYPYVHEPFGIEQKIIRDADLMQIAEVTWYDMIITRLGREMSIKYGRQLTDLEMIEGQISFLKNINLYTDWGKNKLVSILPQRLTTLINILSE
jgi:hypothetical protein